MAYPKLPNVLPPPNSPEYVALAREMAVKTGAARNAPRTYFIAERRKAERRYQRLINSILKKAEGQVAMLVDPTPQQIINTLLQIASSPQFERMCEEAARQTVTMLAVGMKRSWRAAATASSQGRLIYQALMKETTGTVMGQTISAIVAENSKLIKTCPHDMALRFSKLARQREFEGVRPDQITREIMQEAKHLREYEARRIARTESAKASTALVQSRAEALHLDFYIWRTAHDSRVRAQHEKMDGVICRWSDPPDPESMAGERSYGRYHPGGIFNCRCIALPVIALEDIKFPAKVHVSGHIETIGSLNKFRERFAISAEKEDSRR
ncbi:MAG: minor capsid protein [Bacteroidales bacterium]|nr:minor capsid protein [Bacteroidales bacterium]